MMSNRWLFHILVMQMLSDVDSGFVRAPVGQGQSREVPSICADQTNIDNKSPVNVDKSLCYWVQSGRAQALAQSGCQAEGGSLATVDSAATRDFIVNLFSKFHGHRMWVGITVGAVTWLDGYTPVVWTNWRPGEPNNGNGMCCEFFMDGSGWNDAPCGGGLHSVCQRPVAETRIEGTAELDANAHSGTLLHKYTTRSSLTCAKDCLQTDYCVKYVYSKTGKDCTLYQTGSTEISLSADQRIFKF